MRPDDRKCTYSYLSNRSETAPNIMFTPLALKWIKAMVDCHDGEVGFRGIVDEIDGAYVVSRIFYPKHCLVSASTCEISPEGEIEIAQKLLDENKSDDIGKVRFWGHSHHNMGTSPSGQDDKQAIEMMEKSGAYCIRAICTKNGEMSVSFFDGKKDIKFENVKWSVAVDYDEIVSDIIAATTGNIPNKEKVKLVREVISSQVNFGDQEYKLIEAEVKALKEKQLPQIQSTVHSSCNGFDGYYDQGNLFDRYNFPGFDDNRRRGKGKNKLLSRGEIDKIVDFNVRGGGWE